MIFRSRSLSVISTFNAIGTISRIYQTKRLSVLLEKKKLSLANRSSPPLFLPKCHYNILQANLLIRMLPSNETKNCIFKRNEAKQKIRKHTCYTGLCEVIGVDLNNFNASTNLFLLATYILIIR